MFRLAVILSLVSGQAWAGWSASNCTSSKIQSDLSTAYGASAKPSNQVYSKTPGFTWQGGTSTYQASSVAGTGNAVSTRQSEGPTACANLAQGFGGAPNTGTVTKKGGTK